MLERRRPILFSAAYLTIQAILGLRGPFWLPRDHAIFAWRMFLQPERAIRYEIGLRDGLLLPPERIVPLPHIEFVGASVDRLRFVPPHLCRQIPDAVFVRTYFRNSPTRQDRCP